MDAKQQLLSESKSQLEKDFWSIFFDLTAIPRPSGGEAAAAAFVTTFAQTRGWDCTTDEHYNVIVRVPSQGVSCPPIALQAHLDMVCVGDGFVAGVSVPEPVLADRSGKKVLAAAKSSLGADDGVGVAAALAVAACPDLRRGPLELIFTSEEETCLGGAIAVNPSLIKARTFVNLDSEEECAVCIGSAGGFTTTTSLPVTWSPVDDNSVAISVAVEGLTGGHTGAEIDTGRASAIQIWGRIMTSVTCPYRLAHLHSGQADNAIPRSVASVIVVHKSFADEATAALTKTAETVVAELHAGADPRASVAVAAVATCPAAAVAPAQSNAVAAYACVAPYGPVSCEAAVNPLSGRPTVRTSAATAMASLAAAAPAATFVTSVRSSVKSELDGMWARMTALCTLAGWTRGTRDDEYGAWAPRYDTQLQKTAAACCREIYGKEPAIYSIHAGLEMGEIMDKFSEPTDAISIGPNVFDVHSPDEYVEIDSSREFLRLVTSIVQEFAKQD